MTHSFPMELLKSVRTPFYYYDTQLLDQTLDILRDMSNYPGFRVHYAITANANPVILSHILNAGLGVDAVSGGEIQAALKAGFAPDKIVFAGVGKRDDEIELALKHGIECLNVESEAELEVIESIAAAIGVKAPVALRVNPNIDAHTHSYITTGLAENKFGISIEMLEAIVKRCVASPHIDLRGLHFHIGSQITQSDPFRMLCNVVNNLQDHYNAQGIYFPIINVGGGLGVDYDHPDANPVPDFRTYFSMFHKHLRLRPGQELHFELGRSIVAQCGSLITKVLYVKQGLNKRFVIVDAGMTDLIRPALYQAHHTIQNLTSASGETAVYDVVGPICESSDVFGKDEQLPVTTRGDLLALRSAGAYGEIMASRYNCRELPASVCS
ncbi:MAG: diaminopimelate decarboxylase [Muribaculaceae bacterium]|nr:diaminopimelate decarboxylase [Muribaculaceae bacterium]